MAKDEYLAVKDVVYKLQLSLLDGIQTQDQLFAAGSVMSRGDYGDVVTERTIVNLCGYPLCRNSLPSDRPRKGHYRISLKEHKVYDLHETYMFCSTNCVVNSRAFAESLQDERCLTLNSAKLNRILKMFEDLSVEDVEEEEKKVVKNGDMGLKIHERSETKVRDVSLEEWAGPSSAIEGYVPKYDRHKSKAKSTIEGLNTRQTGSRSKNSLIFNEMDFMSDIIMSDQYGISKLPPLASDVKSEEAKRSEISNSVEDKFANLSLSQGSEIHNSVEDQLAELSLSSAPTKKKSGKKSSKLKGKKKNKKESGSDATTATSQTEISTDKASTSSETILKSSLKSIGAKRLSRSVTWADEKVDETGSGKLCEVRQLRERAQGSEVGSSGDVEDDEYRSRVAAGEACARALSQAAEAVASGCSDVMDAVKEAGIIVLPQSHNMNGEEIREDVDMVAAEPDPVKCPRKNGVSETDFLESEDSLFDDPPEGFCLTLSPFATMYGALFEWITSCSLAYIYGRDESHYEDYLTVNGREYPRKIVMEDGRSSEIKLTLDGCLNRALMGLVADHRLPSPVSNLEKGMSRLLDTMSFATALPGFRMKQWQLLAVLFLEALSVCRIPALTPHMTNRRMLLQKVLDGAQISAEHYDAMRDLVLPLGRVPQFSSQSGA